MWKDHQEKGESHLVLTPFEYRTAVIFQALIPTVNYFQTSGGINLWIWIGESVLQTKQCQLSHRWSDACFFSFHICWSNILPLFAVSDSPSNNVDKQWSCLEVVKWFKVKDRFPSKSVQRNSRSSEKFNGDQLCYGLSNLDLMVECDDHIFAHWKESPYTNIGIGMLVFIVNKLCSSFWVNCVTSNPIAS